MSVPAFFFFCAKILLALIVMSTSSFRFAVAVNSDTTIVPPTSLENSSDNASTNLPSEMVCRHNVFDNIPIESFVLSSCYQCFMAISQWNAPINPSLDRLDEDRVETLCQHTGRSDCKQKVIECCKAAEDCCALQNQSLAEYKSHPNEYCPATWDDISCIEMTPKNSVARVQCPKHIWKRSSGVYGSKICLPNATWYIEVHGNLSWEKTSYERCFLTNKMRIEIITITNLTMCCISLAFLLVSLCIFLGIRQLRKEKRIQMHVNLFIALFLQVVFKTFIHANDLQLSRIIDGADGTIYDKIKFCKFIGIANRFFISATCAWYVCEAIFLHRLLDRALTETFRSLKYFYLGGWVIPLLINIVYCVLRILFPNADSKNNVASRCWLDDIGALELVHRLPILLALIMNTCFLIFILHTVYNLQSEGRSSNNYRHCSQDSSGTQYSIISPETQEKFRRSVRAALLLAPLFGLNLILVMVRSENNAFNICQGIVAGSQGALVAIIFCFMNEEVKNAVRMLARRRGFNIECCFGRSSSPNASVQYSSQSRSNSNVRGHNRSSGLMTEKRNNSHSLLSPHKDVSRPPPSHRNSAL